MEKAFIEMFGAEYDILDELRLGDTKMQLCQRSNGKAKVIRLWSSLSKQWNVMYRYGDIDKVWSSWKILEKNQKK